MELVTYKEVGNDEIASFRQECLSQKVIIHGGNNLDRFSDIKKWKQQLTHLEKGNYQQRVQSFQYFIVNGDKKIIGIADIKPKLNQYLEQDGGHISYTTRPIFQNQGFGKRSLQFLLHEAKTLGLQQVLLTCKRDNQASKAIIIFCGGRLKNTIMMNKQMIDHYIINIS